MSFTAENSKHHTGRNTTSLVMCLLVAALLWFIMFSPWTSSHVSFWACMVVSAVLLVCLALTFGGNKSLGRGDGSSLPGSLILGITIAAVLWAVFYIGDKVSQFIIPFARAQVNIIYNIKGGISPTLLSLLLLSIIGPAEEIFWRGYVQRTLANSRSPFIAFLLTTACYALVHLPSWNFMLIMAALVCGICWGGLYWIMPHRLGAIIISHALWDAAAFVWFPF